MTLHLHWYLPTNGDSRDITGSGDRSQETLPAVAGLRAPTVDYLGQVARAAEQLGYEAVLTPTGTWCEDAWIFTAALSQLTRRLKFLVAFRPGFISPTLAAHQAATFQRVSGGRLLLNVVTGGDPVEQRRFGDRLGHDQRYQRTEEFLEVLRGVAAAESQAAPFGYSGEHYEIESASIDFGRYPLPPVFFGGASPAAERTAARQADVYLAWGEADRLLDRISPAHLSQAQQAFAATESVGQQRMTALHATYRASASRNRASRAELEVSPNLWAGYGLVRGGAGTALVGSHAEVADRIEEYHALGVDHFILSGQPHLEEAYYFAEGAAAELRQRGLVAPPV